MAVGDAHVFPGSLTAVLTRISFQSHRQLLSHASAEVRGENTPERNFASTGSLTHNHQAMSRTRSLLSHPGGALELKDDKTVYSKPCLVPVKLRKDLNNVSCRRDKTEIMLKAARNTIQSLNRSICLQSIKYRLLMTLRRTYKTYRYVGHFMYDSNTLIKN